MNGITFYWFLEFNLSQQITKLETTISFMIYIDVILPMEDRREMHCIYTQQ